MQALLIVDIQNDYFPGGAMELVGSPEAASAPWGRGRVQGGGRGHVHSGVEAK